MAFAVVHRGPTRKGERDVGRVAQHDVALASTEQFPAYSEDVKEQDLHHDPYASYPDGRNYLQRPPTPHSNVTSDGIRAHLRRSTRRTDSPSSYGTRVSKSPIVKSGKNRKKPGKSNVPKINRPLSILTKDMAVPIKDVSAWVNRPVEVRRKEVEQRNGYVTRPMNSFMLYRSAYAERTKQWCLQNNHQVVSSLAGESWPMEPQGVRDQYNEWAKIERANHAAAHPEYKFSPSKLANKRRKDDFSDDEDDPSDPDGEPGDEEQARSKSVPQRRQLQPEESMPLRYMYAFDSHPYYSQQGYGYGNLQDQYDNPGSPLQANVAFDHGGLPYSGQIGAPIPQAIYQHQRFPSIQGIRDVRVATPNGLSGLQQQRSIGGYGLPHGQQMSSDEFAIYSRSGMPMTQHYSQYSQPTNLQYTDILHPQCQHPHLLPPVTQEYTDYDAYWQAAPQPQAAIDPNLEAEIAAAAGSGDSHFGVAAGDLKVADLADLGYY